MTAQASNIPVAVDYTSRDYYALRDDLITLVKNRVNQTTGKQWSGDDPTDFGVALIEAFAYIGDVTNYYIDRIANETFLPTAVQRKNIINLAGLYGYTPTGYRSSIIQVKFSNESDTEYTIPSGTQLTAEVVCDDIVQEVFFTTSEDAVVPAGTFDSETDELVSAGEVTIYCTQGENVSLRPENLSTGTNDIAGELLGTSNDTPNQSFILSENQVVEGSVQVYVQNGDVYEPWTEVTHLSDHGPNDAVFQTLLDEDNFVTVLFGDGISGAIPNNLASIKAQYVVGGGTIGNIGLNLINTIYRIPGLSDTEVSDVNVFINVVNVSVGVGGSDPEDNASIRQNASKAISAINRAVSLTDYANLALYVINVGKANATAEAPTSVTLYVAPVRNVTDSDMFPGKNASNTEVTSEWTTIQTDVVEFLTEKTQIGVSLTVSPPTYVPATIEVSYTPNLQYSDTQVIKDIKETLLNRLAYAYLEFEQVITPEDIEYILKSLPSVRNARVTGLYRSADASTRSPLVGGPAEIFAFSEADLSVTAISSDSSLTNLTSSSGTVSPVFDSEFFSYNITGVGTDTITLTPTKGDAAASVSYSVAGSTVTNPISTPSGTTTTISIIVVAPDGITTSVYTAVVSRP